MTRPLTVLVASDGSPAARAAASLASHLPWPDGTRAAGVVATATPPPVGLGLLYRDALVSSYHREAHRLDGLLRRRFPASQVASPGMQPVQAILAEQRKRRADVIVVGSRGRPGLGLFPLGRVSRRILREAPCAVIVARGAERQVRRVAIAVDGSAASNRAVRLIERMKAPSCGRVLLIAVARPVPRPLLGRAPASVRAAALRHIRTEQRKREAPLRRHLQPAAERLRRAGWTVTTDVRLGAPLVEILKGAIQWRADILAFGTRTTSGWNRLLVGSVADGLVSRAPMSIAIAK